VQIRSVYPSILRFSAAIFLLVGCHAYEGSIYRVKEGEDVSSISEKFQVSQEKLMAANPRLRKLSPKKGDNMLIPQKISRAYIPKKSGRYVPLPKIELDDEEMVKEETQSSPPTPSMPPVGEVIPPISKPTASTPAPSHKDSTKPESKPPLQAPVRKQHSKTYLQFFWPAKGKIVSTFGKKDQKMHNGIDIKIAPNGDIKASETGTVVFSGSELDGYGNLIIIRHKPKIYSIYAYLGSMDAKKGDSVKQGQVIAKAGKSDSTSFFHFEIRKGKQAFDPMRFLPSP